MAQTSRGKTSTASRNSGGARSSGGARNSGGARSSGSKTGGAKKSSSKPPASAARDPARVPRRRGVAAAVFFILSAFSFIAYWNTDGAFIGFFVGLAKNLIGHGFYSLPPVLLLCAVIMTFHRGRPVLLRTVSALMLSVMVGSLVHLFTREAEYSYALSFASFGELWRSGADLLSGGVIGGSLADASGWLFGRAGSAIVLVITTLLVLLSALNKTISGIVDAIRNRERLEYIPEPEYEREEQPRERRQIDEKPKRNKPIHIPLDGDETPPVSAFFEKPPKESLFKNKSRVKTPDQLISEYAPDEPVAQAPWAAPAPAPAPAAPEPTPAPVGAISEPPKDNDTGEIEDLPLDIPFMEGKRGQREPAQQTAPTAPPAETAGEMSAKKQTEAFEPPKAGQEEAYVFPPVDLLAIGSPKSRAGDDEVRINSERLEAAFQSFGVNVRISNATRGPAVTRYEAELEAGVKLSKLTGLADDIALSLGTSGVRIAAMPNKISTVGIEVPNKSISKVYLRDIIESQAFIHAKSKLTFAIGMNIAGDAIVGVVPKLPHLLVAGTTGSGKSVCLNSIILSILYKATPDDVRFIMIDPKMVEFKVYNDIPHLLVPVVTDIKKAAGALQWAVFEMMKRYALFSETSARDIDSYNQIAHKSKGERAPLPQIIVVIDELADLMMMAAKEVEESVCRVAQMGRAAGMHLVIATQSPRADVITGLMKANIPSRISFKVSSALESRIILDAGGNADKLVGHGDMLYAPTGSDKPMRVQGTWVSDKEREKVVDYIKKRGDTQYSEEVMGEIEKAAVDKTSGEKPKDEPEGSEYDELLPQAVDVIFETGQASVSMLQRRLKLGYSRAARIVDQMEQMGVVGPFEGSKPRAVLVTKEQWRQMQYISGTAPQDAPIPTTEEE